MNAQLSNIREETYKRVTDSIIKALDAGTVPWQKTWVGGGSPANAITKKSYRGMNRILLSCSGYDCRFFATYKQIQKLGGTITKGQEAWEVIFWNFKVVTEKNPNTGLDQQRKIAMMRLYNVYNLEQTEGIDLARFMDGSMTGNDNVFQGEAKLVADTYIKKNTIKLSHGGHRAYYSPLFDSIRMPAIKTFKDADEYGSTLFHEITHSTGHASRLKREGVAEGHKFGDTEYSFEELVAEMGASFLSSLTGISNVAMLNNSASYITGWKNKIEHTPTLIMDASSKAQKAVDLVISAMPIPEKKKVTKRVSRKSRVHHCSECKREKVKDMDTKIYTTTVSADGIIEVSGYMCEAHREAWWADGYDVSFVKGKTKYELS